MKKNSNPPCPKCDRPGRKMGKNNSGTQRYRCLKCKFSYTPNPARAGRLPFGDKPMSNTETSRRYCERGVVARQAITKAVWEGEIDQCQTSEVAAKYGITARQALKILMDISLGKLVTPETPFTISMEWGGETPAVFIKNESTFTFGSDPDTAEGRKGTQHYVWFSS